MRVFWGLIVVLLAASVAALMVLPETIRLKDVIGWEPSPEVADGPAKDDSRVPTVAGEAAPGSDAAAAGSGPPTLKPILVEQLPFEASCGLFLTPPDSRDVIFIMPDAGAAGSGAVAALNIEGNLVMLHRSEAEGEPIGRGAYPRQVFHSEDGTTTVVTRVGAAPAQPNAGADQRVTIESGELTVMMPGRTTLKMPVAGQAGC